VLLLVVEQEAGGLTVLPGLLAGVVAKVGRLSRAMNEGSSAPKLRGALGQIWGWWANF